MALGKSREYQSTIILHHQKLKVISKVFDSNHEVPSVVRVIQIETRLSFPM